MITGDQNIKEYLDAYHTGRIAQGKGIGCDLDDFVRFKHGTFNMVLGHDNVGKTYWRIWYYLCLSVKYNYKWCIWTGENKAGQIVRNLIQWRAGKDFKQISTLDVDRYRLEIMQWFTFVDNSVLWKYKDLLDVFGSEDYTGCLIDPYTGLDRKFGHSDNYEFLNATRQWVNQYKTTIDVCTHPSTASGRIGAVYPQGHEWAGHIRHPFKADTEGGKPFGNRCDDFITVHRLTSHPIMKTFTMVYIDKIKDHETGGNITDFEAPVMCEFNNGLGFKVGGVDPLRESRYTGKQKEAKQLTVNNEFLTEAEEPF